MNNPITSTSIFSLDNLKEYHIFLGAELLKDWNNYQKENLDNSFSCNNVENAIQIIDNLKDNGSLQFSINYNSEIEDYEQISNFLLDLELMSDDNIISEDYFEEFCQTSCFDIGYISSDAPYFITNNIDWVNVSNQMKGDYKEVLFDGDIYLFKS